MVIVALIYAENLELVRAKPDLSWKEGIKDFCLYQHQEEMETLLSVGAFSINSPNSGPFWSVPVLLCPLQWGRPTKTLQSVSCSSCRRIFSFTAPGSYYTTTYFVCLFIVLSVLESKPCHSLRPLLALPRHPHCISRTKPLLL